jgi:transcriptional regulator with XRE-family HTH domain
MEINLVIRQRLEELGLEQKQLASAAQVTESYVSQLLTRKKSPPAPSRTDIYGKMEAFLKLTKGRLSDLADFQRREELKRSLGGDQSAPLFKEVRELILRKCAAQKQTQVRAIFETQPFGELERLVTQKLLDVVKQVAKGELENEDWLHLVADRRGQCYEQTRVNVLEFLDTDIFNVSVENCTSFLDPLIEFWDIDLASFSMDIVLNSRLATEYRKRFEFVETQPGRRFEEEPGFLAFLKDAALSASATPGEIEFLKKLKFKGQRPTPLYYYRELQSLRDPLHFRASAAPSAAPPRRAAERPS